MKDIHIYIHKHIGSYRIVSRRPRRCIDTANDEQTATVRVPSAVALVALDELHAVLHSQQATEDSHLRNGNPPHLPGDLRLLHGACHVGIQVCRAGDHGRSRRTGTECGYQRDQLVQIV